ncbi:Uncharacterised protein [Serratia odorifera]|uniref:Uncharacterized protein n=1 Tax=Serratia odorifera TaxID=618 RepID=A0A3S4E733_SEROD|nr:Uncharacterised protein [Serratia odorifera]
MTIGSGGIGIRSAQEAKNSTRSSAAGAFIIFDSIPVFPLVVFTLLAQLLLSALLFSHHCAITGVIRAQCDNQPGLLRQCLLLLGRLLPRQFQSMR